MLRVLMNGAQCGSLGESPSAIDLNQEECPKLKEHTDTEIFWLVRAGLRQG